MNRTCYLALVWLSCLLAAGGGYAADGAKQSLIERIHRADEDAILEAGKLGDPSYIPALETQAQERTTDRRTIAAKMALAKLGVKKYLDETIAELTTTNSALFETEKDGYRSMGASEDIATKFAKYYTQQRAFQKLAYIRNPSTIKIVASFLYSTENPNRELRGSGDQLFGTPAGSAARTLRQIVDNPPQTPGELTGDQEILVWQQWWEKNKDKYP